MLIAVFCPFVIRPFTGGPPLALPPGKWGTVPAHSHHQLLYSLPTAPAPSTPAHSCLCIKCSSSWEERVMLPRSSSSLQLSDPGFAQDFCPGCSKSQFSSGKGNWEGEGKKVPESHLLPQVPSPLPSGLPFYIWLVIGLKYPILFSLLFFPINFLYLFVLNLLQWNLLMSFFCWHQPVQILGQL